MPLEQMRVDMHLHSDHSRDSVLRVAYLFRSFQKTGILPLICDHNSLQGSIAFQALLGPSGQADAYPLSEEIITSEGEVIGMYLSEEVSSGRPADETVDTIHNQGGIVIVPHPFDRFRKKVLHHSTLTDLIGEIDVIEGYNGRNLSTDANERAVAFANQHHLPISAGSDAHIPYEVGKTFVELDGFSTPQELCRSLWSGTITYRQANPLVHLATKMVKAVRR